MKPFAPAPDSFAGINALAAWMREKSILGALQSLHRDLGDAFRLTLPGFDAVMLAGAGANRCVLVEQREHLRWRMDGDPVGRLLRSGILMQDGAAHDDLRAVMKPPLHREAVTSYIETFSRYTDELTSCWDDAPRDMLLEMRRLALCVLLESLFGVDVRPYLDQIWQPLLRTLEYISPGAWLVWQNIPRPGYGAARQELDRFLYALISARRSEQQEHGDVLDHLIGALGADDELIRDQVLTLLIAGHDTSTALLAWTLYLLGAHPHVQAQARAEIDSVLGCASSSAKTLLKLVYLEAVIKESLRLYPPIHTGNRRTATDLEFQGYGIPGGTRVLYSIYLSHRDARYWHEPNRFQPERFTPASTCQAPPFAYIPFGGGPRFCIGAAFAQTEAKVILAGLLQRFEFELLERPVRVHMGATLEPRPGVWMRARKR